MNTWMDLSGASCDTNRTDCKVQIYSRDQTCNGLVLSTRSRSHDCGHVTRQSWACIPVGVKPSPRDTCRPISTTCDAWGCGWVVCVCQMLRQKAHCWGSAGAIGEHERILDPLTIPHETVNLNQLYLAINVDQVSCHKLCTVINTRHQWLTTMRM